MEKIRAELQTVEAQIERKNHIKGALLELYSRRTLLTGQTKELREKLMYKRIDVEKLAKKSITMLFYKLLGWRDILLSRERKAARAIRIQLENAQHELEAAEAQIQVYEDEERTLSGIEDKYENLLRQALELLKAEGGARGDRLTVLTNQITAVKRHLYYTENALHEVQQVKSLCIKVFESIRELETSVIHKTTSACKERTRQVAEFLNNEIIKLKEALGKLTAELPDSTQVYDLGHFAYGVFDGLFLDLSSNIKFGSAFNKTVDIRDKTDTVIGYLTEMRDIVRRELDALAAERLDIIKQS